MFGSCDSASDSRSVGGISCFFEGGFLAEVDFLRVASAFDGGKWDFWQKLSIEHNKNAEKSVWGAWLSLLTVALDCFAWLLPVVVTRDDNL